MAQARWGSAINSDLDLRGRTGATALSGPLAERLGSKGVLMVSLSLLLLAMVGLHFVASLPTVVAYSVLLGGAAGSQRVVAGMIWPTIMAMRGWAGRRDRRRWS